MGSITFTHLDPASPAIIVGRRIVVEGCGLMWRKRPDANRHGLYSI